MKLDIYRALAIEEWILRESNLTELEIYAWMSESVCVLGRFQNPWREINTTQAENLGVQIARRISGGGCVYQDSGNLNLSFMYPKGNRQLQDNLKFVIAMLRDFGIEAVEGEKLDLLVKDQKVSGSAVKQTKSHVLHHLTLLIDSDLGLIRKLLHRGGLKIEGKGIQSRPANMVNLSSLGNITAEMILEVPDVYSLGQAKVSESWLQQKMKELTSWEWIYGLTPDFRPLESQLIQKVSKGKVVEASDPQLIGNRFSLPLMS